MTEHPRTGPQFYLTAPAPCPYLEGRWERKVFTHLVGERAPILNDVLTHGGFRRSQTIAYRPACENCRSCLSVRVVVNDFAFTQSMRRVLRLNADLVSELRPASPTSEQYALFRAYIDARHGDGGMAEMSVLDYAMMVEDTHVRTKIVEYRDRGVDTAINGKGVRLQAACLTDLLVDGISLVYSYFEPARVRRSPGTFLILDQIRRAKLLGLPYVYLGYWVEHSPKMDYKRRFAPLEVLGPTGWHLL